MRVRLLALALLALPMFASAQTPADKQFVEKAAQGGLAEVELGKVAQQKATNPQVKDFAARMVTDHGKANEELKQVASKKGIALPSSPSKEQQEHATKMQALNGAEFDRAYMKHMLDDHKKDVAEFEKQSKSGGDADVKSFAAKTLPTLKDHLKQAEAAEKATRTASR